MSSQLTLWLKLSPASYKNHIVFWIFINWGIFKDNLLGLAHVLQHLYLSLIIWQALTFSDLVTRVNNIGSGYKMVMGHGAFEHGG